MRGVTRHPVRVPVRHAALFVSLLPAPKQLKRTHINVNVTQNSRVRTSEFFVLARVRNYHLVGEGLCKATARAGTCRVK